ncbi:hypothetical protein JTE90_010515 [Oedothorax gibbosus]|uniref:WAP domain-containing protein n=1 Tax=Oedothorax gibbosus TaxID=931172 RepID=A0AAV6W5M3_9ARAC|nr:hypothetical protein JTE90_010515 [Oedothorax gibbosus]
MHRYILICFTFIVTSSCATVGEFPFHAVLTESTTESASETTIIDDSHRVESENTTPEITTPSERLADIEQLAQSQQPSPFLQVIRDFLFQARDGLLDPEGVVLKSVAEGHIDETSEKIIKAFERGVIEATTLLVSHVEDFVVSTMPTISNTSFTQVDLLKRVGDSFPEEPAFERIDSNSLNKNERQLQIANLSMSCSNCYDTLQSCVQRCFETNNCNDVERNVRSCPPVPNRLCNPFTPWSPVNECQSHKDCKSPLLCCNDGCIDKCTVGVWSS